MKRLLVILFFLPIIMMAQDAIVYNHPKYYQDGDYWVQALVPFNFGEIIHDYETEGSGENFSLYCFYVEGDTIIDNKEYKCVHAKMWYYDCEATYDHQPEGLIERPRVANVLFMREDADGKQWRRLAYLNDEALLFDFSHPFEEGQKTRYCRHQNLCDVVDNVIYFEKSKAKAYPAPSRRKAISSSPSDEEAPEGYFYYDWTVSKVSTIELPNGEQAPIADGRIVFGWGDVYIGDLLHQFVPDCESAEGMFLYRVHQGQVILRNNGNVQSINNIIGKDVLSLFDKPVEVAIDNLNYFLDLKTHEAIVTAYHTCSGEVNIPSEVNYNGETFIVKSMLWCSFYDNKEITKVSIPKTLVNILHYYPHDPDLQNPPPGAVNPIYMNPFIGCISLESIEVDEENTSFKSVDGVLFSQDGVGQYYYKTNNYYGTGLYCYPAGAQRKSYAIPDGVEWIGSEAFSQNQFISTLTIPNSLKQICGNAFRGCSSLANVYCYAENVPVTFTNAFENFSIASATLHVPASSVDKYKNSSTWKGFGSIVALPDPVIYTAGLMATIILPTTPDASKGKYYRLDRCEDGKIIFEEELNPKAHVPYIIVPNQDFIIDLSTLDLVGLSQDTVSIQGIRFIGSYRSEELDNKEGWYVDIIDTTPDCSISPSGETEKGVFLIGALRAYLQVSWNDPYSQGPTKGEPVKMEIVLHDNPNGIAEVKNDKVKSEKYNDGIYDLQGRCLLNKPAKGLYIQNGEKIMVK